MLDSIRSGAQSFGVKIAFGIIILVFVFWGVGNFNDRDYTNVVAVVNGEPILAIEFEKAYQNAEEYILRNNPGMSREQLVNQHLGRQILRDLVQETLLQQEAERAGINITPFEMRHFVNEIKTFQDSNGKFDPEIYKKVLAAQRISPAQYEKNLANQLLHDKLYDIITAAVWVDPDETKNRFNFLREKRLINYIFIPSNKFADSIKISMDAIKKWYETHKDDYIIPEKIDISYISVQPEKLVDKSKINEEAAKVWYDANKNRFETKEQVKVSHILVPLNENFNEKQLQDAHNLMDKIRNELKNGKDFSALADEYNRPGTAGKGGELGWISRGETVPEFEEAIFNATPGKVTEVINTPLGLHLILVQEKKAAGIKPFNDVKDEVKSAIAFEEGSDQIHEVLDNLIEDNILQRSMEASAAKYGLKAATTGLLSKSELMDKMGISANDAETLFATPAGSPVDTAITTGDSYIIARIMASEPKKTKELETVQNEIQKQLLAQESLKNAMQEAADLLNKIKNLPVSSPVVQKDNLKSGIAVERNGTVADFAPDMSLDEDIFAAAPGTWLNEPHAVTSADGQGAVLVYVDKVLPPETGEFEAVETSLRNAVMKDRQDAIYAIFMQNLLQNAKVEIKNQNLIDRTNR